ncbi:O-methyltransferase [Alkaliphilus peptidifermentans]|uniref:Predicted O-methyltransferase YrrM n=1 Tax=Alkaliphilus peptidifermentans DSM 18978 TaxID=1120976 RepID=A0A1G5K7T1_9FIRM|nr:class I SAM-dependent methyltransferase [Alkaliphilus peptidifermentans]SCY96068.1 Predicted O-methyltransferase YrrM [Alkaliphilus peptidifermentans DSM 18978]
MAYNFKVNKEIIENVIDDLKSQCFIPEDSVFCHETDSNPQKDIYYNDYSFLDALGHYRSIEIVDNALDLLKERNIVTNDAEYPLTIFDAFAYKVKSNFIVPWKSFTPTMERLVYMLSWVKKPTKAIFIGVNCGYTLAWMTGAFWKNDANSESAEVYGVDINPTLLKITKRNFDCLDIEASLEFIAEDGYTALNQFEDEYFDLAFLDTRKSFRTLEKLYKKIKKDGWLLMHNASDRHFEKEMKPYVEFVRDKQNFSESILFNIDTKGLELSVKGSMNT